MDRAFKSLWLLPVLAVVVDAVLARQVTAQSFTTLYAFTPTSNNSSGHYTNSDGAYPYGGLILSSNTLFGTASAGGNSGNGTVFALNTAGTGFTVVHSFTGGSDGASPSAGLTLSGNTLYGTASKGGSSGNGTLFSILFAPQLTIALSNTNLVLSWPISVAGFDYTGYVLQSTANLVSPLWTTNLPTPVVVNGQNTVTTAISGTQQFYRLSQ